MIATIKAVADISAASITVATILNWLQAAAALFTIIWIFQSLYQAITGRPFSESKIAKFLTGRK